MVLSLPNYVQKDKHDIVRQVKQLHNHDGSNIIAKPIFLFVKRILEPTPASQTVEAASQDTMSSIYDSLPEFPNMPIIAGDVASEIACNVVNEVDSHNITLSVLKILQKFSWGSKVALTVATFVLTFGDSGLNMTAESKLNVDKSPYFSEDEFKPTNNLIKAMVEATSCIVDFENLPTTFFTSEHRTIKYASIDFLVAVYMTIRAVVVATFHNIALSSKGVGFQTATLNPKALSDWAEKLKSISDDLNNILPSLYEHLQEDVDIEAYNLVKEIVLKENQTDNTKVLNALISNNNKPQLYDGCCTQLVDLDVLKGKTVLLLVSNPDIADYIVNLFKEVFTENLNKETNIPYGIVWFPIVKRSLQNKVATEVTSKINNQKACMPWYSVRHPKIIKNVVIKFFEDEWEFKGDPIVVVLDSQGNVVHQNAMHMIHIWRTKAAPFTNLREETLWKKERWMPNLLLGIDNKDLGLFTVKTEVYYIYGSDKKDWKLSFISAVDKVDRQWTELRGTKLIDEASKMIYVGRNGENYVEVRLPQEGLPQVSKHTNYFWPRIKSMISSLKNHANNAGDHAFVILQNLQRLLHYEKTNVEWVILAESEQIQVLGHGGVVLSTLQEFDHWNIDFKFFRNWYVEGFKGHYRELCLKKFPCQRIEFPAPAKPSTNILCPDCNAQMGSYNTFLCYHPYAPKNPEYKLHYNTLFICIIYHHV